MWSKVSLGFDVEEETVNFGTRKMAICDSAVYETNTVAVISKETVNDGAEQTKDIPEVRCSKFVHNNENATFVVVNETVVSFNSSGNELLNKYSFEFLIDCFLVWPTIHGTFLLLGLNNGDLHCLPLSFNGEPTFLKNICNNKDKNKRTFISIVKYGHDDACTILLTSYNGIIYSLRDLNLRHLGQVCSSKSKDISLIIENLKIDYVSLNRDEYDNFKVLAVNPIDKFGGPSLLLFVQSFESQELLLWSSKVDLICCFSLPKGAYKFKKLRMSKKGNFIFALTVQGTLLVICPYTLSLIYHHQVSWRDFEPLQEEGNNFLVLTSEPTNILQLISLPGFKIKFQIEINEFALLAEQQSSLEDLFYLEAHCSKTTQKEDETFCDSIYLKVICESQPEYRLERILRRGKFDEAENFARTFNLDIEIVHKSHLQKLLQDIQPWTDGKISVDKSGADILTLLQKVKDTEFVGKCALHAISSDFVLIKSILIYAANRIQSQISEAANSTLQDLYCQIRNSLLRLNTFMMVGEQPITVDAWLCFCKVNLIEECLSFLKQGLLNQAMLIWSGHIYQLKDQLSYEQTIQFFKFIPSSIHITYLLDWFQIFLPVSLSKFPSILPSLICWCKEKIHIMELLAVPNWMEIAISFSKKMLQVIRLNIKPCLVSRENIIQAEYGNDSPLKELLFYVKILTEISYMKKNYGVSLTIAEYTQANSEDVMYTILDKIPLEELNSFVNGFFEQLILQKNLNADLIISDYIQSLVEGSVNWWYWEEAPWESRIAVLVNCIASVEEKLKTILCILRHSPVPWSPTISSICDDALKYKNPLTKLLHEQKKMVNCKLILKKYNLKENILTKTHINRVLLYIFSQTRNTMLEDGLQIANTFDLDMCKDVYKLYAQHLIENKEFEKFLSFLNDEGLSMNLIVNCCEAIILKIHCLSGMPVFIEKYGCYMEVLDAVSAKLTEAVTKLKVAGDIPPSIISPDICEQLKRIYFIKINYKEDITIQSFVDQVERDNLIEYCLEKHLKIVLANVKFMKKESVKLNKLADCFECTTEEMFMKFIRLAILKSEINVTIRICKLILQGNSFSAKLAEQVIDLGCMILQFMLKNPNKISGSNLAQIVHNLVTLGLNSCCSVFLPKGIEISNWCKLIENPLPVDCKTLMSKNKSLPTYFSAGNSTIILNLLATYFVYLETIGMKFHALYLDDLKNELTNFSNSNVNDDLLERLSSISCLEQESVCFPLMTTLHWSILHNCFISNHSQNECPLLSKTKFISKECVSKLLKKSIGSRHLDAQFGLALLYYFPKKEASDWIIESSKRFKHDFQRLYAITELGIMYFRQYNMPDHLNDIYNLRKQCVWGKQIMEYGLSYKEAFRESPYDRKQLLLKLMSTPSVNVDILGKYCKDVNFDFQRCLKVYLRQTLLAWEPEFEVKTNTTTGESEIFVKTVHKKLLHKCREIIALIENVNELYEVLSNNLWDSINYYYYEVFLISITLMEENGIKPDPLLFTTYRTVFLFLSSYQRISEPQDFEKESWYQTYPNEQNLPPISKYRLPFRLIFPNWCKSNSDPWKIIRYELNIQTYKKWFALLDALELDKNVLCTLAINQITCDETNPEKSKVEWCIHMRNQKLLSDVESCIENISNLEMASASLYYVVNHLPPGADQLAAAKICFMHAKKWRDAEKSEKAETGFLKVQKKYLTISTTHILYSHNLGKGSYLQLVLKPVELIHAIYNDPIILQKNSGNIVIFPDINKAAEEICTLHKIDISQIRTELLDEWLQPENFITNVSGHEFMIGQEDNLSDKLSSVEYENFQRACYVIARDINTFGRYLVDIVFDQNSDDSKPISIRLRALQCLYAVVSECTLSSITKRTIENLTNYMDVLKFLHELEILGMTYSVSAFESAQKMEIVKSLLSFDSTKSIHLAARICRHFGIVNISLWNEILSKMCSFEMIPQLAEELPILSTNCHLLDPSILKRAWNTLLTVPLIKAPCSLSEEQSEVIEKRLKLINFCPIVDNIDLQTIRENCHRINREDLIQNIQYLCS